MADLNLLLKEAQNLNLSIRGILKLSTYEDYDDLSGLHINYEDGHQNSGRSWGNFRMWSGGLHTSHVRLRKRAVCTRTEAEDMRQRAGIIIPVEAVLRY